MERPPPIDGESIGLHRMYTVAAVFSVCIGPGICLVGILLIIWSIITGLLRWQDVFLGATILAFGLACTMSGLDTLLVVERLILGTDRMQMVAGRRVRWEIPYDNIDSVTVFSIGVGDTALGFRLHDPSRWYFRPPWPRWIWARHRKQWKKLGYDLILPSMHFCEPLDRIREACLRCIHHPDDRSLESA